jgi:hypothetical protein
MFDRGKDRAGIIYENGFPLDPPLCLKYLVSEDARPLIEDLQFIISLCAWEQL